MADNENTHQNEHKIITGHENFRKYVKELEENTKKITYFLFEGERNSMGLSWCSDCNVAEVHLNQAWEKYKTDDSEFIVVDVGNREYFKDKNCLFRNDRDIYITNIPTLLRWRTQRRLTGDALLDDELLKIFFTEEF